MKTTIITLILVFAFAISIKLQNTTITLSSNKNQIKKRTNNFKNKMEEFNEKIRVDSKFSIDKTDNKINDLIESMEKTGKKLKKKKIII